MSLLIREVLPTSSLRDAALIPNFTEETEQDVLAIAKGNKLIIYPISTIRSSPPQVYEFFNEIMVVCPVHNEESIKSNILLIFANFKACIFGSDGKSKQNFSIENSSDLMIPIKVKYSLHPDLIAIQTSNHHIEIFQKTSNCLLNPITSISIGCKKIIGFCFCGPTDRVKRLAILIENFTQSPSLQIAEIDSDTRTYSIDQQMSINLPQDSYYMFSLHPEKLSTIIVLTTAKCLRITYKNFTPKMKSATISTQDPILNCDLISGNVFCFVDDAGSYGFVEIDQKGEVMFVSSGTIESPYKIISLTHNLLFIISHDMQSCLIKIRKDYSFKILKKFETTGRIKKVLKNENEFMAISEKGSIKMKPFEETGILEKVDIQGGIRIFSKKNGSDTFYRNRNTNDQYTIILSKGRETIEIGSKGQTIEDSTNSINQKTLFFNEIIHCTEHELRIQNETKISDNFRLCEASHNMVAYVNAKNELHLLKIQRNENDGIIGIEKVDFFHSNSGSINNSITQSNEKSTHNKSFENNSFVVSDETILSIALNDSFLAVMTSFITVYQISNQKIIKTIDLPNTTSLLCTKNELISLDNQDYVYIHPFSSLKSTKIRCEGTHTRLVAGNGYSIICGSNPSLLIDNKVTIPLNCVPFYDCAWLQRNQFFILNFHSIQKIHIYKKSYSNECTISSVPISSFVRLTDQQFVYSRTMNENTYFFLNKNERPFYSCQNFVCIDNANNTLNIISKNNVMMFDKKLKKINGISFDQDILNFIVNHQKRYIYQKKNIIDLESSSFIFQANESQEITFVSMNDRYTIVIINKDTMVLFLINDDNSYKLADMINCYEEINCMTLNRDTVIIGTNNHQLYIYQIENNSNFKLVNIVNFLSSAPTSIDKFNNTFLIGFECGKVIELTIHNLDHKFVSILEVLQSNVKCEAGFCKQDQFLSQHARFDEKKSIIFDLSVLTKFYSMDYQEQKFVLNNSTFSVEDVLETTNGYNNLFLS
ncbi:hypothetical protein TRFO_25148 [Tritrichomonas foetus]|uniref:Cleavage/polyadenylation specificity factor A subunit N-terminal domain-containing protein n=1 Tax=Tritrichomonas foetus TaxID=1144522 RepID=A0A1J4KAH9_9EUKA|nr:hypothetical protein TRFO_25148 [Tritrichomonas foetus]|eukprot:OHT06692.1 hypothetical protein TRFO_25148 [Tritrichomonas foetus]